MQVVFAVSTVSPGQEFGATYIEPFGSLEQRRKRLQDRFGFLCSCPACCLEGNELKVYMASLFAHSLVTQSFNKKAPHDVCQT